MKPLFHLISIALLSIFIIGCTSTDSSDTEATANTKADTSSMNTTSDKSSDSIEHPRDPIYANDTLNKYVAQLKAIDEKREEDYYERYASIKGTYGDVYFFEGKVAKTSFSDSDIGMNGSYVCYYNAQEQLVMIEAHDHGNTWYRQECFVLINDTLYEDIYRGEYGDSLIKRSFNFKVADQSWMDKNLYNKTKRRAKFLMQEAVYNQVTLPGTRYYQGMIDGKHAIQMKLHIDNTSGHGKYHYESSSEAIDLSAQIKNDSIIITEQHNGTVRGKFKGILSDNYSISGTWINKENTKSYPFNLELARTYKTTDGNYLQSVAITPEEIEKYGNQVFGVD